MSYSRNIYIGWYAEFDRSKRKISVGVEKVYLCPNDKKHPSKGKFCSVCGSEIVEKEETKYRNFPIATHIFGENSQKDLDYMTGGLVKVEDIKSLEDSTAIFPEFLETDKEIVMAPGYTCFFNVSHSDGFAKEMKISEKPSEEWIEKIKKVFDTNEVEVKYGFVMEII